MDMPKGKSFEYKKPKKIFPTKRKKTNQFSIRRKRLSASSARYILRNMLNNKPVYNNQSEAFYLTPDYSPPKKLAPNQSYQFENYIVLRSQ